MTEASRRDVLPFRQILESLRRIYFTIKKLTEGCRRDVLPFCKVTEGRRKDVWAFCKKKGTENKNPPHLFSFERGIFVEVLKLFYQLFKIIAVAAFSVFFGRF